jgi:hypothetical protein
MLCDDFWSIARPDLNCIHSWFIHESSVAITSTDIPYRNRRNLVRNGREFFLQSISFHTCRAL